MRDLLRELCCAFGPSGYEDAVRAIIERELKSNMPESSEIIYDNLGGIYLHVKNEGKPRLMISAHMDEVGFMVTGVTDGAELRFGSVGGINPLVLSSKRVVSERGVKGVISSKPIHLLSKDDRKKRPSIEKMLINVGAQSKQEALDMCDIGEYFTFDSDFVEMGKDLVKAKALDDRHGCCEMLRIIEKITKNGDTSPYDLYFAFTCREEVGYSGACCASELVRPDYAVVIESKAVVDLPGVSEDKSVGALGKGALISYADLGAIMDRGFTEKIISVCKENKIKYQINRAVSGGNDSHNIQVGSVGARVALVSAPSRYIHSGACVVSYEDLECICEAIYKLVTEKEL